MLLFAEIILGRKNRKQIKKSCVNQSDLFIKVLRGVEIFKGDVYTKKV